MVYDRLNPAAYGVHDTNPAGPEITEMRETVDHKRTVRLSDPDLVKILRLRLLGDPSCDFLDISYCWGQTKDGGRVLVNLGFARVGGPVDRAAVDEALDKIDGYYLGDGWYRDGDLQNTDVSVHAA